MVEFREFPNSCIDNPYFQIPAPCDTTRRNHESGSGNHRSMQIRFYFISGLEKSSYRAKKSVKLAIFGVLNRDYPRQY